MTTAPDIRIRIERPDGRFVVLAIPRRHADRTPATMPWHTLAELDGKTIRITLNPPGDRS